MEGEINHLLETNSEAPLSEFIKTINEVHVKLGLLPHNEMSIAIFNILKFVNSLDFNPNNDRLKFYVFVLSIILYPYKGDFPIPPIETDDDQLLCILITYSLRKQIKLPLLAVSRVFNKVLSLFTFSGPFYYTNSLYYYKHVPEMLKSTSDIKETKEFISKFFDIFLSFDDLNNISHSTIVFINNMIQQIISYIIQYKQVQFVSQCNVFFTRIFSLQTISPSVILLHFLHLWCIFIRFCTENDIKVPYEPQIHLISDIIKRVSIRQKHELYRFLHWHLAVTIRVRFEDPTWQFNSLCLILTFYKTILHIELMRNMIEPSQNFLNQMMEQYDNKNKFSFFTLVSFFDSSIKEHLKLLSKLCLIVINSKSTKTAKQRKVTFTEQMNYLPEDQNISKLKSPLIDELLYTVIEEKKVTLPEFTQEFENLISKCELLKTKLTTSHYFILPCFSKMMDDCEENLPYIISIVKSFMKAIFTINRISFLIFRINIMPNKNPDLVTIVRQMIKIFNDIPEKIICYISSAISKQIFTECKKFRLTVNTIETIQLLPDLLFNSLIKDMVQTALSNQYRLFAKDFESTYLICRYILLTTRLISANSKHSISKDLSLMFKKTILQSVFSNIKKISNQSVVFQMLKAFIKHLQLDSEFFIPKPSQFEEAMPGSKKDFLFSFLSLLPTNFDQLKFNLINPILEFALKNGDQDSIAIASKFCINIFSPSCKNRILADSHFVSLYQAWRNANLPKSHREKMIETIPFYTNACIQGNNNGNNENIGTISFEKVYECIYKSMSMSSDSVYNAFSVFQNSILNPDLTRNEMLPLLHILIKCMSSKYMKERIDKFIPVMLKYHADLFINEKSNLLLLCLLEVTNGSVSHIANEMHDLSYAFFQIIIQQGSNHPMIKKTVSQILYIFPHKERVYSILSGLSLFVKFCPELVSIELIRTFLIASNDVYVFDVYFNRSLYQLLDNYVAVIDQDKKQELADVIYSLFSSMPISYRLVIVQILQKLNCKPPNYQILQNSQFKTLELQKITASLLFDREITPELTDFIKKSIIEKAEPGTLIEKLSRRMTLIYGSIANEHNFSVFIDDQNFAFKLVNFISNSIASGFKTLRKVAKKCFSILIQRIDTEKKISFINDQFDNPLETKVFSFYGDRVEKISYFKRLMTIKPNLISSNLVLNFIDAIGSYVNMNEEDRCRFLPNVKVFFNFLGSKKIIHITGVKEAISTIAIHHTQYFMFFIENCQKLLTYPQLPYFAIAGKPAFNFLIKFPTETVKCMLQSPQSTLLYYLYLDLIEFNDSTPLHNHFIHLCKSKYDPFLYPLYFFDIIVKMSKIKSCVENDEFLELIDFIIEQYILRFYNFTNNLYFILFRMVSALTNIFKYVEDISRFIHLLHSLELPLFFNTHSYSQIVERCIKQTSQKFKVDLISYLINNPGIVQKPIFDNALQHAIKETKEIPGPLISEAWIFLLDTDYIYSILRLLQHQLPSDDTIDKICQIIKKSIMESNTENIIYSLKIMIHLIKLKKLPEEIYWIYIKQSLLIFKFLDPPFAKHTFRLLKLMNDNFQNVPDEIVQAFAVFAHYKCSSIREVQKTVEILFCAKPLCQVGPFSPIILISCFLEAELPDKQSLPIKASFDCLLSIGIKYMLNRYVPESQLNKFFMICYKYIELMINGLPYHTFLDNFSAYSYEHQIPPPPPTMLSEILKDGNKFLLPSFISFFIIMKSNPEEALKNATLVEKSLVFIQESDVFIHSGLLHHFILQLCKKERYVNHVYNAFVAMSKKASLSNKTKIFQTLFAMLKANVMKEHHEKMYDFLIKMDEKDAYAYLPEEKHVSYTSYIMSKCHDNEVFIMQTANSYINDDRVSKDAKILLISNIASFVNYSNAEMALDLIENIETFSRNNSKDFTDNIADILIETARCSSNLYKLKCIQKLRSIVPNELNSKLDFVFNILPLQSWRNETVIFVVSVFATDLKKWLPIFSFGNSFQSISSQFVVYFLQPLLTRDTIRLFSEFFSKILSIDDKSDYDKVISGITYCFFDKNFPIHPKTMAKAASEIQHPEYLTNYLESESVFTDHPEFFLPHYLNDCIYGKFSSVCSNLERAAIAATLLNKHKNAESIYSEIDLNESDSIVNAFHNANNMRLLFSSSYHNRIIDFSFLVNQIENATSTFDMAKLQSIDPILNEINDQFVLLNKPNVPFFKQEISVLIETMIQISKHFIEKKQNMITQPKQSKEISNISLNSFLFIQSINPALISFISDFKAQLKSNLGFNKSRLPEIEFDPENPPILLIPSPLAKKFKKISGLTTRGLSAVSIEQVDSYLQSVPVQNPPTTNNLVKLSPVLFEIYLICPSIDFFNASYSSYSKLIQLSNSSVPLFVRQQAGARLLFLLQNAKSEDHFKIITSNAAIFERKHLDIWRLWLTQLVILSKKKQIESLISPLFLEMGYRTLLYAKRMNMTDIEKYLTTKIPTSLLPLDKLGCALDKAFKEKGFEKDADQIISLINNSLPFVFPLYKSQMSIYQVSDQPQYLSDRLILLTLSTTISCYTPILIQKTVNSNSDRYSLETKTLSNALYMMNLIIKYSYSTKTRDLSLCVPFVFEIGDNYLMTVVNGQFVYLKDICEQALLEIKAKKNEEAKANANTNNNKYSNTNNGNSWNNSISKINNYYYMSNFWNDNNDSYDIMSISNSDSISFWSNNNLSSSNSTEINPWSQFNKDDDNDDDSLINLFEGDFSIPSDILLKYIINKTSKSEFIINRHFLLRSYTCISAVRHIFSSGYPKLKKMIMYLNPGFIPALQIDYENNILIENAKESSIRYSPNIYKLFGEKIGVSILQIGMAAVASSFIDNLESVRSYLEVLIWDRWYNSIDENKGKEVELKEFFGTLIQKRSKIEEKIINLAPPSGIAASPKDFTDWISNMDSLMEKAMDMNIQPPKAIPWF